jgi:hypothetical protein
MGSLLLNEQQLKDMDTLLGEIPYKFAAPIVFYLKQKFAEQNKQEATPSEEPPS